VEVTNVNIMSYWPKVKIIYWFIKQEFNKS